ncbi:MAG: hypothetical protein A2816_00255 [Candidatus Yanofskybacteria bacterium RIFCSPHIGHO2_01_FULL_39_44]|nr:MAG: hypothetical protein A2816_00255 [Candidatus Yanofskybacteria bacterium RIFCSPHIGHO2_01_FULL_39_44]
MNIVTIGGGGGHAQVLKGLKHISGLKITAICPSTDSGGSTGLLSQDYGNLGYLGDLTKCVAALCPNESLAKSLLYRFEGGCLNGHSVKNILLLGLEKINGLKGGLEMMYDLCNISPHQVIPVTTEPTKLCALLRLGNNIEGEAQIDNIAQNPLWHPDYHAIKNIRLDPDVPASPQALDAINVADWCVICPGDLYSSILPILIPKGIAEALSDQELEVVIVLNIMTKQGETDKYKIMDFVTKIEEYLRFPASVILCNNIGLDDKFILKYALERKVQLIESELNNDPRIRFAPLATVTEEGFVYHDPQRISIELEAIFK